MGQSGSAQQFRDQFSLLDLQKYSKTNLWHVYHGTTGAAPAPASPNQSSGGGDGSTATAKKVTVWQLNTQHPTYTSALCAPKQQKGYKIRWVPNTAAARALEWVKNNPHPNIINVAQVAPIGDDLFAVSHQLLTPLADELPRLHATEIMYGFCNLLEALLHMHERGFSHRNINWGSLFVDGSQRRYWVVAEMHFMSSNDPVDETCSEGRSPTTDLLNEIRTLREAKHLPFVAPEENNPGGLDFMTIPIGAGDVYSFGQLLEQVVSMEKRLPATVAFGREDCSVKAAADALRHFAKQCMAADPTRRPPLRTFYDLPCVKHCVFITIMRFLDDFKSKTDKQKVAFFATLHLEVLKLSYDLFTERLLPRFLTVLMWCDPSSELFVRHLLLPSKKPPNTPLDGVGSFAALDLPPTHAPGTPLSNAPARSGDVDEASASKSDETEPRALEIFGLLQAKEYRAQVSPFLKAAFQQHTKPALLCTLFRYVDLYVVSVDLTVVNGTVIPAIIANLRHPCHDVALAALRAFTLVSKFVFAATDRGADCGTAVQQLTAAFDNEIYALAASDSILTVRLAALGIAARSFSSRRQLMSTKNAVIALCHALNPLSSSSADSTSASRENERIVASKGIALIRKIIEVLAPDELVTDILPSLVRLSTLASQRAAAEQTGEDAHSWPRLRDDALALAALIVANVRDRDADHQRADEIHPPAADSTGTAQSKAGGDTRTETTTPDESEIRTTLQSGDATNGGARTNRHRAQRHTDEHDDEGEGFMEDGGRFHGRAKIDSEGWLSLRAPCRWGCRVSRAQQRQLARPLPQSEIDGRVGAYDPITIAPKDIELSVHDYDQGYCDSALLTPVRVIGVQSSAKVKAHPHASRLVTRFVANSASGVAGSAVVAPSSPDGALVFDESLTLSGKKKKAHKASAVASPPKPKDVPETHSQEALVTQSAPASAPPSAIDVVAPLQSTEEPTSKKAPPPARNVPRRKGAAAAAAPIVAVPHHHHHNPGSLGASSGAADITPDDIDL